MCTYNTEIVDVHASAKGHDGWFNATTATVYFDHPVHYQAGHALMIDVLNPALGARARVGIELDAESARELAEAILKTLESVPQDLLSQSAVL